ncbi:MAG TPA: tRNA pseudouridine(55) synthase TruB [Acidimicrobiales bacterium]
MSSRRAGGAGAALDGLVVVDKEAGWTSHDVVAKCRGVFQQRRAGHAGTLDPDATGVLLVGLGRVTRVLRYLTALPKTYSAEIVLGVATSTLDASGEEAGRWDMGGVTLDAARRAASALTGDILQVPPMVSALKVGGRRLHELAREGIEVDRQPRPVTVHRFDLSAGPEAAVLLATVTCSSGTYVRSLAADLGTALGGGAHLRRLRRVSVGSFGVDRATPVGGLGAAAVLTPADALRDYPSVTVDAGLAGRVVHGAVLPGDAFGPAPPGAGPRVVLDGSGAALAVYEPAADGGDRLKPSVVLAG